MIITLLVSIETLQSSDDVILAVVTVSAALQPNFIEIKHQ